MKNNPEQNFFAIIPTKILTDRTLSSSAKLLFACVLSLTKRDGFCFASNSYMAELLNFSPITISRLVGELEDAKYIHRSINRGIDKNVIGTERKLFILIDTSQWGILGDVNNLDKDHYSKMKGGVIKNDKSSFVEKEKIYAFRELKAFFIEKVKEIKRIDYLFSGGKDGNAIKSFLSKETPPPYKELIDFYLKSEKSDRFLSISAALSADTINQYNLKFNKTNEFERIWKETK